MIQIGLEDVALQHKVGKFAVSNDGNETCRFQLFDVMRERGGAHGLTVVHGCAGHGTIVFANLFQDFVPPRISQSLRDEAHLIF
jgi:hypothetical protein